MRRLFLSILAISALLTGTIGSGVASAVTTTTKRCNPITAGLNQGANNLQLGNYCPTSSSPSNGTTTPINNMTTNRKYAALGDSVAAGLGLSGQYGDARCGRTTQSYPYLVAQQKGGMILVQAACKGATVGDLVTQQGVSGPNISSQLSQVYADGPPSLITITAGANDLGWIQFITKCYVATCGTATDTAATSALRTAMELKYRFALSEIQFRSNGHPPQVLVTGYYNPISNFCKGKQQFATNAEIDWLNSERNKLNQSIRNATAGYSFVKYASANFDQHGLCAAEPWSQGINDPAPLHPTARGQQEIAKSVLAQIR
jgi:lysophospholipase L1-like esterase